MKRALQASLIYMFCLSGVVCAADDPDSPIPVISDQFRFSGTLSFWAPADQITGYMKQTSLGTLHDSIADNLGSSSSSVMATLEGHYGRFGLLADYVYWDNNNGKVNHAFAYKRSTVYASAHSDTQQNILTGAGTYTIFDSADWYLDSLLGIRYITNSTSLDLDGSYPATIVKQFTTGLSNSGVIAGYSTMTAPVVGIKGRARIGDGQWFLPFYGDIGSAGKTFSNTWQAQLGIARNFDWFEINLSCRALYFELADGPLNTKNYYWGPSVGITAKF